ncbi:MAG: hypothetical protein WB778_09130 [Thermoplasmata archaeon]
MPSPVLTANGWPKDDQELSAWYANYENWASNRARPIDLEVLRERLWESAAAGTTVTAGSIMDEFHLVHGGHVRAIGYVVEIVSEFNRRIVGHADVYLSSIVVTVQSKRSSHPKGLPLRGYFRESDDPSPISKAEERDAIQEQKHTQQYCKNHPFKRWSSP